MARISSQGKQWIAEMVAAGLGNAERIIDDALSAYYHHHQQQQAVTVVSKKVFEAHGRPEIVESDGKAWLNLGSGLLAEHSAAMLAAQIAGTEIRRNALEEVLVYNHEVAMDNYASIRCIIMWKFGQ